MFLMQLQITSLAAGGSENGCPFKGSKIVKSGQKVIQASGFMKEHLSAAVKHS